MASDHPIGARPQHRSMVRLLHNTELLYREIFYTLREAEVLIEAWRRHGNAVRPHSALG